MRRGENSKKGVKDLKLKRSKRDLTQSRKKIPQIMGDLKEP